MTKQSPYHPNAMAVNVADRWNERLRSYLGMSDREVVKMNFEPTTHTVMYG